MINVAWRREWFLGSPEPRNGFLNSQAKHGQCQWVYPWAKRHKKAKRNWVCRWDIWGTEASSGPGFPHMQTQCSLGCLLWWRSEVVPGALDLLPGLEMGLSRSVSIRHYFQDPGLCLAWPHGPRIQKRHRMLVVKWSFALILCVMAITTPSSQGF